MLPESSVDLFDFSDKHIRRERSLTPAEAEVWETGVHRLQEFRDACKIIHIVAKNAESLDHFFAATTDLVKATHTLGDARDNLDLEGNRLVVNFLATMRLFLDGTEGRLKKTYGKDSSQVEAFKARTTKAYDETFGYRFLYRLRNVSQHAGAPIGKVTVRSNLPSPDASPVDAIKYAVLLFDTATLLRLGGGYWGNMRQELESGPQELEVMPQVREALSELVAIDRTVVEAERAPLSEVGQRLVDIAKPIADRGGVPAVGTVKQEGKRGQVSLLRPPPDIMTWLGFQVLTVEL